MLPLANPLIVNTVKQYICIYLYIYLCCDTGKCLLCWSHWEIVLEDLCAGFNTRLVGTNSPRICTRNLYLLRPDGVFSVTCQTTSQLFVTIMIVRAVLWCNREKTLNCCPSPPGSLEFKTALNKPALPSQWTRIPPFVCLMSRAFVTLRRFELYCRDALAQHHE